MEKIYLYFLGILFHLTKGQLQLDNGWNTVSAVHPSGIWNGDLTLTKPLLLDTDLRIFGGLTIKGEGNLVASDSEPRIRFSANFINILEGGSFQAGSEESPYQGDLEIELTGSANQYSIANEDSSTTDGLGEKGIFVQNGGSLQLHGKPKISWTRLTADFSRSDSLGSDITELHLEKDVSSHWEPGDELVLASSDFDHKQAEVVTVSSCSSDKTCTVFGLLSHNHHGTERSGVDYRAEVGLLSRNIKVYGSLESQCQATTEVCDFFSRASEFRDVFGGQIVFTSGFSVGRLENVELKHMGQAGIKGRYAVQWLNTGSITPGSSYARSNSLHHSVQRGFSCSDSQGCEMIDNVLYNVYGHGFSNIDSPGTVLKENLGVSIRSGIGSDSDKNGVSVFWLDYPPKIFEDNVAAGCENTGVWLPLADSRLWNKPKGTFHGNTAHSCRNGFQLRGTELNRPLAPEAELDMVVPQTFSKSTCYRSLRCFWIKCQKCSFSDLTSADTGVGALLEGGPESSITDSLFVGKTEKFVSEHHAFPGIRGKQFGVRLYSCYSFVVRNSKFKNFEAFLHNQKQVEGYAFGFRRPEKDMMVLSELEWEKVELSQRLFLAGDEFDPRLRRELSLRDLDGSLLGTPGLVLPLINPHHFRPHCFSVQGWGWLVYCPEQFLTGGLGQTGSFITTTEEPLTLVESEDEVVELDSGGTAPDVQVVHNQVPDHEDSLTLETGALFPSSSFVLGYCLPMGSAVEVTRDNLIFEALESPEELDYLIDEENSKYFHDERKGVIFFKLVTSSTYKMRNYTGLARAGQIKIKIINLDQVPDSSTNCMIRSCYFDPKSNGEQCLVRSAYQGGDEEGRDPGSWARSQEGCLCGEKPPSARSAKSKDDQRIVGGREAEKGEYPWIAGLVKAGKKWIWCGGTLISNQWVLTAGHCVRGRSVRNLQVLLGEHNTKDEEETQYIRMELESINRHPLYNRRTMDYDFCLLKMRKKVVWEDFPHIRPLCLPLHPAEDTYVGRIATVAGWGTRYAGGRTSEVLREVEVEVISNTDCHVDFGYSKRHIKPRMMCATAEGRNGGKDACQGDSGGPLIVESESGNYELVGDVSWGYGCARKWYPGIYGRITTALEWIERETRGSWETCPRTRPALQLDSECLPGTCKGRCGEGQDLLGCNCHQSCLLDESCCCDYQDLCEAKDKTETSTTSKPETTTNIVTTTKEPVSAKSAPCLCGIAQRKKDGRSLDDDILAQLDVLNSSKITRIVGGTPTQIGEYPWQVAMVKTDKDVISPVCGGSLLSDRWVLTAKHCVYKIMNKPHKIQVLLGEYNTKTDNETLMLRINVKTIIGHPGFSMRSMTYDAALLLLESPVDFDKHSHIRPICLPSDPDEDYSTKDGVITGWGSLRAGGRITNILREADVDIFTNKQCTSEPFGYNDRSIHPSMVCAGVRGGGIDACQGDSGGPLIAAPTGDGTQAGHNYELVGIVSWGKECALPEYPGVYTRVTSILSWIKNETHSGPHSWKTCPRQVGHDTDIAESKIGFLPPLIDPAGELSRDAEEDKEEEEERVNNQDCFCGLANRKSNRKLDPNDFRNPFAQLDLKNITGMEDLDNKIVGGHPTEVNEYPWQAGLVRKKRNFIWCGGSLIADRWVVTAQHCVGGESEDNIEVLLGEHNTRSDTETETLRMSVVAIIHHHKHNTNTMDLDVSLLKLSKPVNWEDYPHIRPICLPDPNNDFAQTVGTVTGWGTVGNGKGVSPVLQEVNIHIYSDYFCLKRTSYRRWDLTPNMVCAGYTGGGRDACQGDSGGPLVSTDDGDGVTPGQNYVLVGVVSWGYGCADRRYPGVFVRVTKVLDWIKFHTEKSFNTCPAMEHSFSFRDSDTKEEETSSFKDVISNLQEVEVELPKAEHMDDILETKVETELPAEMDMDHIIQSKVPIGLYDDYEESYEQSNEESLGDYGKLSRLPPEDYGHALHYEYPLSEHAGEDYSSYEDMGSGIPPDDHANVYDISPDDYEFMLNTDSKDKSDEPASPRRIQK